MAEPFIGEVDLFGFDFVPENWASCSGTLISITQNQALYALLGNMYGGDGRTNFALPDLRGKMAQSFGEHPGSRFDWRVGQMAGSETWTMRDNELAQHAHSATFTASGGAAEVEVSTDAATQNVPTDDSYVASPASTSIYRADAGAGTVALGGVIGGGGITTGTVTVGTTGTNTQFNIIQSTLILNYCIAMQGLFPSRN